MKKIAKLDFYVCNENARQSVLLGYAYLRNRHSIHLHNIRFFQELLFAFLVSKNISSMRSMQTSWL